MMQVPFTTEQFVDVFTRYNGGVWPAQVVLLTGAAVAVALATGRSARSGRSVWWVLAALWAWAGAAYHVAYFAAVTSAAYVFGGLFLVQAVLLAHAARRAPPLRFRPTRRGVAGAAVIVYALALYPLLGYVAGHRYPAAPTFGAPCPVTLFTFGMLLLATSHVPMRLFVIPAAWSMIGATAALRFGMLEDLAMPAVALFAIVVMRAVPGTSPPQAAGSRDVAALT